MENKVLEVLVNAGKPLRPGDIAKELGVDSKEVSKAIAELKKEGKNPFQLDYTKDPNGELQAFLAGETRFAALDKKDPEVSKQLKAELDKAYNERHALYKQLASLPHPGSEN